MNSAFNKFVPPPGGRVHILTNLSVILDQPWRKAIKAVRNTPDDYSVWNVGHLYLPTGAGIKKERIVLVNFGPSGGDLAKAVAWAKQYNLKRTDPRHAFAIAECIPDFNRVHGTMFVVATKECFFDGYRQVCSVWWGGREEHCAYLRRVNQVGDADDWFAFLCK